MTTPAGESTDRLRVEEDASGTTVRFRRLDGTELVYRFPPFPESDIEALAQQIEADEVAFEALRQAMEEHAAQLEALRIGLMCRRGRKRAVVN